MKSMKSSGGKKPAAKKPAVKACRVMSYPKPEKFSGSMHISVQLTQKEAKDFLASRAKGQGRKK